MEITLSPLSPSISKTFYSSLHELKDGERIRKCLQCGTCSGVCPFGYYMKYPPGKIIGTLRAGVFDLVTKTDSIWMCVSCSACSAFCPTQIPITQALMTRVKEEMILAGSVPAELQTAFKNSQQYGNPLGESPRKRADWATGIQPEVNILGKTKQPVDVLWFVGDYASYHPRMIPVTKSFAKILNVLGIKFGILGPEESSDGDSQRLAGERGIFEMLAKKNGQAFKKYQFREIITTDPHAYNALKNEYPALGISYPVRHFTEFLFERLDQIKPLLKKEVKTKIAYHDPCYLGRVNGIYDAPREILKSIPGVELVEMAHQFSNSLCCGGGGGGMWLDGFQWERAHVRLSEWRVKEALECGADLLAVACPYEPPRFEDATKTVPNANQLKVREIAELLAESMDL
ncbi:MAG: (Fe-S)-binding protein [Anaerolineaceae bacterium]|nr:MAG: (Fe-S)-binding protein [Anaerolineaceae bacterium]